MPHYSTVDSLLDDVSQQMVQMSNLSRRSSRASIGQRPASSMPHPMRITKPSSANNSPQRPLAAARRRSVMNDGLNYRRPIQQSEVSNGCNEGFQNTARSSRPLSWHPSSQLASQTNTYGTLPYLATTVDTGCLPYSPSVYSGYNSPALSLSPYSDGYSNPYQSANMSAGFYQTSFENPTPSCVPTPTYPTSFAQPQYPNQMCVSRGDSFDSSIYSHFDWNNYSHNNFNTATTPPTPEALLPIQTLHHAVPVQQGPLSCHPFEEVEDDGEVLVALGLYDAPEKSPVSDGYLNNFQRTVASHLFESVPRKESMGKGLKLEETWNPPANGDENDGEED